MKDLVTSVVTNYDWSAFRAYANSLSRCGFQGEKLLFVRNITQEARDNLIKLGFRLIDHYATRDELVRELNDYYELGRSRFRILATYLADHVDEYRYIVATDMRDVIFQSDPSVWLANHEHDLVCAHESWLIRNEPWNSKWMRDGGYAGFDNCEALCSGTFAGTSRAMLEVFTYMALKTRDGLADQGTFNYLIRTRFKDIAYIPRYREGFTATCAAFRTNDFASGVVKSLEDQGYPSRPTDEIPLFNKKTGTVMTSSSMPFCIVHQYDRDVNWKEIIERKYE